MKLTDKQRETVHYFIEAGAKAKGRWVSAIPKSISGRAINDLVDKLVLETKQVPVPRSKWPKRKRIVGYSTMFFRVAFWPEPKPLVRPKVALEIRRALLKGKHWTDWRPFLDNDERLGAARCGTRHGRRALPALRCRKYASHVRYSTGYPDGIHGRIASCENCLKTSQEVQS